MPNQTGKTSNTKDPIEGVSSMPEDTPVEEVAPAGRDALLRKAYATATTRMRNEHRDMFNALYTEEAKLLGVDWTPPPTAEEKAREQAKALVEQFGPAILEGL